MKSQVVSNNIYGETDRLHTFSLKLSLYWFKTTLRIPHVRKKKKNFGQRCFSYCAPKQWNLLLWHPPHSVLPCLQNCVTNSPVQTIPQQMMSNSVSYSTHNPYPPPLTLPHSSLISSERPCVCERETDRQRDRETERQTDRDRDRERERQTDKDRDRHRDRQRDTRRELGGGCNITTI